MERLIRFGDRTLEQIMVPRVRVVGVPPAATVSEMLAAIRVHGYTRYPLFEGDADHISGLVAAAGDRAGMPPREIGDTPSHDEPHGVREEQALLLQQALQELVAGCPRLRRSCFWAWTSAIALEELRHRDSFDLDLHTIHALEDVRPLLAEVQKSFGERFTLLEAPDSYGSGFSGLLQAQAGDPITVQVMASFEEVPPEELVPSRLVTGIRRVSLAKYLRDKLTCLVERAEARDLVDVMCLVNHSESLKGLAQRALSQLDEILLVERLLKWTDEAVTRDLEGYPDVDPRDAFRARDLLLGWLKP